MPAAQVRQQTAWQRRRLPLVGLDARRAFRGGAPSRPIFGHVRAHHGRRSALFAGQPAASLHTKCGRFPPQHEHG
jgi:hypothetical protein